MLPQVDAFLPAHNLASREQLARLLAAPPLEAAAAARLPADA